MEDIFNRYTDSELEKNKQITRYLTELLFLLCVMTTSTISVL